MADRVDIMVLVDNSIDIFLQSTDVAAYPEPGWASRLWAEQGLSLWIEVHEGSRITRILYDFGRSEEVLLRNADLFGLDFKTLDWLVLSHGHVDHYACLYPALKKTRDRVKLRMHPKAWGRPRFLKKKDGTYAGPMEMDPRVMETFKSRVEALSGPSSLGEGIHLSGEIAKTNPFEQGMPNAFFREEGRLIHDPIEDDQALYIELDEKGLVVITGCCHAGAVNTLEQARRQFPGRKIHALIGGLHLNNAGEEQMEETMAYLERTGVRYIAATHCTGYYAQRTLMNRFSDGWIPVTVGATLSFAS
jgi:7,8-dihydropterin-6-yl-methyl-4-(beta-D-ribofuranosyl)aminobenzene 5'-phosphate synthase